MGGEFAGRRILHTERLADRPLPMGRGISLGLEHEAVMLVTFHSNAAGDITMFGDVAVTLLKMTGHSGTVPSALLAGEIPAALARLKQELAAGPEEENRQSGRPGAEDADNPPPVGLRLRAYPLIQLLSAAARQQCNVMWEEDHPTV